MKIQFTPSARSQFLAAIAYIFRDSPSAAIEFRRKSEKALLRLRKFPQSGHILPEFPDLPFRELLVPPYRCFYRVKENSVWVVAVWHSRQLPEEPDELK